MKRRIALLVLGALLLSGVTACIPLGPACWWITPAIQLRGTTQGEVFLSQEAEVEYSGGTVLLSSTCDGSGDIWVDDKVLIRVTRPDGTTAESTVDFSFGCQGYISTLGALDVTPLFAVGRNRVHVELSDICGEHVGSTALYLALEHGAVLEESALKGLDVNATQGSNIDWSSAYDAGYRFVYVKATSGDADLPTLVNAHFENQVDSAKDAGLAVGVYHFAYPETNNPEDEALYFLDVAGDYIRDGYLRPALDIEALSEPAGQMANGASLSEWIRIWIESVEAATGVEPLLYTTSDYAKNHLDPGLASQQSGYDLWIAHWRCNSSVPPDCGVWNGRWAFWQYWAPTEPGITGCGHNSIPGIGEDVDLDIFNGGMSQLAEYMIEEVNPPDDSLVAYYNFDQAVMTTLLDNSQYLNIGDIMGQSGVVPGVFGSAFSFDGVDDWGSVPDSASLRSTTMLTIDCWVKPASFPAAGMPASTGIVAYGTEWQGMWELRLMGDGALYFLLNWNTGSETSLVSTEHLELATWQHVVATFDGEIARVYLDGSLVGEEACSELLHPGEGSYLAIGLDFPGADEYFHGLIDELRIYNEPIAP
jgi:GH25 family lysozyme M1 (1,4-beta-N-acetylmuramidase)